LLADAVPQNPGSHDTATRGNKKMKALLASTILAAGLLGLGSAASAAECGDVTIANMNWQSAEVAANIDKLILEAGYGCHAELVVGDTVPTLTSMAEKGEPDIAPEAWVSLQPEIVNRGLKDGKFVSAAKILSDGAIQGWWIPKYIAEAHPDIKTIPDLFKHPELFPAPEDKSKGAVFNGPQGWGGTVVTAQLFKAYGGDKANFTLVDTGSAAGLDGSIAKAYEAKQPWVGYYWAPTALLGKYEMVKLGYSVEYNADEWKRCTSIADCADPKENAWPSDSVETLVTKSFADRAGSAMDYLNKRAWTNDTVNKLIAWMSDNQASGEEGAKYFLKNNEDLWKAWVSPEAAEKIKASL
jgi:glycine betaine/proline transport system substrate-binding protein